MQKEYLCGDANQTDYLAIQTLTRSELRTLVGGGVAVADDAGDTVAEQQQQLTPSRLGILKHYILQELLAA